MLSTTFQDARNTQNDSTLIGPPSVEYAPYPRVPGGKVRKDARQGTIDQDADFVAFLESLTNPVPKPSPDVSGAEPQKEEKVTTTPLIQYLKEKKASKGKEQQSPAKPSKRGEAKDGGRNEKVQAKKLLSRAEKATPRSTEKQAKLDKATKEAVKAANKQLKSQTPKPTPKDQQASPATGTATATKEARAPPSAPAAERRKERGDLSAATKILRRDLGLTSAASNRKRGEKPTASAEAESTKKRESVSTSNDAAKPPTAPKGPKASEPSQKPSPSKPPKAPPTEPAAARKAAKQQNAQQNNAVPNSQQRSKQVTVDPSATQAFLKHANPSQGVTESLLDSGFSKFGKVTKVEIDKKKGFGYVDFAEPRGLQSAIQASPVQIAQSQVVVLERKSDAAVAKARVNNNSRTAPVPSAPARASPPQGQRAPPQGPRGGRPPKNRGFPRGRGGGGKDSSTPNTSSERPKNT